jgi:Leucine-rich repeat (LRR) protein
LTTLPDEIGALESLEDLSLAENPFVEFPRACLSLPLTELSLARAPIRVLPRGLDRLPHLRKLVLHKTELASLAGLEGLAALEDLDLASAEIDDLSALGELRSLRRLDLTWVRARIDAGVFRALARTPIRSLTLHYASLEALPPELGGLTELTFLDVRSTEVKVFPEETARLRALTRVLFEDFRVDAAALKRVLPPGRWRKQGSGSHASYARVDAP